MTIYGASQDPIFIKKIALKIWRLRDEIESIIQEAIHKNGGAPPENLDDLVKVYTETPQTTLVLASDGDGAPTMSLVEDAPLDSGEDEMLKAMQEGDTEASETTDELSTEDDMAQAMSGGGSIIQDEIVIKQTIPAIDPQKLANGKTLLSEITMDQIFFFCDKHYMQGQSIVIEFAIPNKFVMNADIVYCRPYNMKSRIISSQKLPFRAVAKFTFLREGERTLLRSFLKSVESVAKTKAKENSQSSKPKESDSIGDELDGLDDLL